MLGALVGQGTDGLRNRMAIGDELLLYYAGYFSHQPRTAAALQCMLRDVFDVPVEVEQFRGHWLDLDEPDQTCLPSAGLPNGRYTRLGLETVIGVRVWDVQSKFRVRIGPLTYAQFVSFWPSEPNHMRLRDLTRSYVGPMLAFDLQTVLRGDEVPTCRLAPSGAHEPRLGWNTWIGTFAAAHDAENVVFEVRDL